jgi:hypothetical protein
MEVKDVVFYTIMRLGYNGIPYQVYNAKTGSTYIRVGTDRVRIADHPGVVDNYNIVIRSDCKNPAQLKGKCVFGYEDADNAIQGLINKYKKYKNQEQVLSKILIDRSYKNEQLKQISHELLQAVAGITYKDNEKISKRGLILNILDKNINALDFLDVP